MKERINKLAKGIIEIRKPEIELSVSEFKGELSPGMLTRLELGIRSKNGISLKGLVYSGNPRVEALKPVFGGLKSRIVLEIDTRNMLKGNLEGELSLVSNAGEFVIPFFFRVIPQDTREIISLDRDSFADLYIKNREKAEELFKSQEIRDSVLLKDERIRGFYNGLYLYDGGIDEFIKVLQGENTESAEEKTDFVNDDSLQVENLEDLELLEAAARKYIREEIKDQKAFRLYERAIYLGAQITRLYEYYMYSMPKMYREILPREVYLYFSYDNVIDDEIKKILYYNITVNKEKIPDIYDRFSRRMQDYAADRLLSGYIDEETVPLYEDLLYENVIDERMAEVLPEILLSNKISIYSEDYIKVIVRYPELSGENVFKISGTSAFVPLYSGSAIFLFEDIYGKRHTGVRYSKRSLMDKPKLLKKCSEILDIPMLLLSDTINIVNSGIKNEEERKKVTDAFFSLEMDPLFSERLISELLKYYDSGSWKNDTTEEEDEILSMISFKNLSQEDLERYYRIMIKKGNLDRALSLLMSGLPMKQDLEFLEPLAKALTKDRALEKSDDTLGLCWQVFLLGSRNVNILTYLISFFNGRSELMWKVLYEGRKLKLEIKPLSERLLAQMIFSDCSTGIEKVYSIYREDPSPDISLIRAYLTRETMNYFLKDEKFPKSDFSDLYQIVRNESLPERVPLIYLFALSKLLSERDSLTGGEKQLLQQIVPFLIKKRFVFPYLQSLSERLGLNDDNIRKCSVVYKGDIDVRPSLMVRILPDENDFQEREMERIYQNIYMASFILFAGESAEYQIYDPVSGTECESGLLKARKSKGKSGDTYDILNEISSFTGKGKQQALKKAVFEYVKKTAIVETLFIDDMKEELF